eukprot:1159972-Pelagomonas_calceolata.AAC.8
MPPAGPRLCWEAAWEIKGIKRCALAFLFRLCHLQVLDCAGRLTFPDIAYVAEISDAQKIF